MIGVKLEFWKNQPLLHTVVQMIAFALLFVSLVFCLASNFVFAKEFNRVRNDAAGKKNESVGGRLCFLDLKESGNFETKESNSYCDYEFVTFGHSFVAITLGTLFLLLAITMFLRCAVNSQSRIHAKLYESAPYFFFSPLGLVQGLMR